MLEPPPRLPVAVASSKAPPFARKSASIARFFSASPESLWASIAETQPGLVADAQRLFEQITTSRQSALRSTSLALAPDADDKKSSQLDKVWAVVAVVATAVASELQQERSGAGTANDNGSNGIKTKSKSKRVAGRKRARESDGGDEGEDDDDDGSSSSATGDGAEDEAHSQDQHEQSNGVGVARRPTWHLVDLLVEANVGMGAFLEVMTSLFDRLLLDPELLAVTTQLKEEFTVATVLYEKYRFVWKKVALLELQSSAVPPERTELLQRVGWLLFLVAHRRFGGVYAGLGNLYYLLLAVLKLMVSQVAPRSVEAEVAAALSALGGPLAKPRPGSGSLDEQSLLDMLCSTPKVDPDEVAKAYQHVVSFVLSLVRDETLVMATDDGTSSGGSSVDDDDAATVLRGVFAPQTLRQNATRLFELYATNYLTTCGSFDERVYLNEQSRQSLLGPRAPALSITGHEGSNGDSHGMPPMASRPDRAPSNPLTSPVRRPATPSRRDASTPSGAAPPPSPFTVQAWQWHGSSPPPALPRGLNTPITRTLGGVHQSPFVMQTPVTAAVEISSWIRDTLLNSTSSGAAPAYVSSKLQSFFKDCTTDPTEHIADVLAEMSDKLMKNRQRAHASAPGGLPLSDGRAAGGEFSEVDGSLKKTSNLAVALFYRVLEALLVSERGRLKTSNFSSLLNNETFISSLFACSLEVGLKAHSLITLSFPFLLDNVGVNAFDFGKVIESFVKHVPRLPGTLKRHMRDLEQMILDSLAWRADSRLYIVLKGETQQQTAPPAAAPAPATTTTEAGVSQEKSSAATSAPRATVLQLFFRKVLSLAATRIFRLGSMLELDAAHMNQVWSAIKECMSSQVHLLRDRHLDQIILCSIYGVCKVNKLGNVTFNKIIEQYKKLQTPQWALHGGSGPAQSAAHAAFASAALTRKSSDVIRDIKLDDDNTRGDVIKFYNRCYIPAMKVFLLQYQAQDRQVAAAHAAVVNATGSRDGHLVTPSTSDSDIVAEAAASAVEKVMQSYAPPRTPVRGRQPGPSGGMGSPLFGSPARTLPMFTTAEVESLPVSVHQTSPKRVLSSNIYMSPLQNARYQQQRSHMTPRSHALYAFGESPSRDLALINRAVNNSGSGGSGSGCSVRTAAPPPLGDSDAHDDTTSGSNSSHTTPTNKRRRT